MNRCNASLVAAAQEKGHGHTNNKAERFRFSTQMDPGRSTRGWVGREGKVVVGTFRRRKEGLGTGVGS